MNRLQTTSLIVARVLLALVFLLNGLGIVDQSEALRELIGRGTPASIAPTLLWIARSVEVIAGASLALGIFPDLAALALIGFLIPATWVGHPFWLEVGTAPYTPQLINFFKNIAIMGGLLFITATGSQASLLSTSILYRRKIR
jgi:putative oxidoreductase